MIITGKRCHTPTPAAQKQRQQDECQLALWPLSDLSLSPAGLWGMGPTCEWDLTQQDPLVVSTMVKPEMVREDWLPFILRGPFSLHVGVGGRRRLGEV